MEYKMEKNGEICKMEKFHTKSRISSFLEKPPEY